MGLRSNSKIVKFPVQTLSTPDQVTALQRQEPFDAGERTHGMRQQADAGSATCVGLSDSYVRYWILKTVPSCCGHNYDIALRLITIIVKGRRFIQRLDSSLRKVADFLCDGSAMSRRPRHNHCHLASGLVATIATPVSVRMLRNHRPVHICHFKYCPKSP